MRPRLLPLPHEAVRQARHAVRDEGTNDLGGAVVSEEEVDRSVLGSFKFIFLTYFED